MPPRGLFLCQKTVWLSEIFLVSVALWRSWQDPVLRKPSPGHSSKKRKVEGRWHVLATTFPHFSEKNILSLEKQIRVNQISNESTPIYHFLHAVSHTVEHLVSTERNSKRYGLWQAIMAVWHHRLISLMSCQYKQKELIISRRTETWEDRRGGGRTRGMEMCEGCNSVRGTWQMGLSLPTSCYLSYWHIHTAAVTLCRPLTFPSWSV